jgi:hypothetical protein
LTTVRQPGVHIAAIAWRPHGYSIAHVLGGIYPLINDQPMGADFCSISHGDVIDLVGARMKFLEHQARL